MRASLLAIGLAAVCGTGLAGDTRPDARELVARGEWELAAGEFGRLIGELNTRPPASWREACVRYSALADALVAMELYDEACGWLESALSQCRKAAGEEQSVDVLRTISGLEFRLGRPEAALESAHAVRGHPEADAAARLWAARQMARCYEKLWRWSDLVAHTTELTAATDLASGDRAYFLLKRAAAHWALRDFARAADSYRAARDALPEGSGSPAFVRSRIRAASALAAARMSLEKGLSPAAGGACCNVRLIVEDGARRLVRIVPLPPAPAMRELATRDYADQLLICASTLRPRPANAPAGSMLGIIMTHTVPEDWSAPGTEPRVSIERVLPGSAAERAGLAPGDRIVSIEGRKIGILGPYQVREVVRRAGPGAKIRLTCRRDGDTREMTVVLGKAGRD